MRFRKVFIVALAVQATGYALYLLLGVDWHGSVTPFQTWYLAIYLPGPLSTLMLPERFGIREGDWAAAGLFTIWLSPLPGLVLYSLFLALTAKVAERILKK